MNSKVKFFFANNVSELVYHLKNIPKLTVVAGCTTVMHNFSDFPKKIICINKITDLMNIRKSERSIEFGSAVCLSKILELETKKLPQPFLQALESIANIPVRNLATIGGNICAKGFYHTTYAPLLALDAVLEIRNHNELSVVPLSKFDGVASGYFLSKIKVPLDDWDIEVFKRLENGTTTKQNATSFTLLTKINKNILSDLRIALAGDFLFRNKELENILIGRKLPLTRKQLEDFLIEANDYLVEFLDEKKTSFTDMEKKQFLNLIRKSLKDLL
ncbi:MAG: FAD binding domain-containing protein [Treponemataceae bacterium]